MATCSLFDEPLPQIANKWLLGGLILRSVSFSQKKRLQRLPIENCSVSALDEEISLNLFLKIRLINAKNYHSCGLQGEFNRS